MRVPVATVLLVLAAGRLGAALVRREAGAEPPEPSERPEPPEPAAPQDFLTRHFQSLSEFVTRELPHKLRAEELRGQAERYLERASRQLEPLARELESGVLGFLSLLRPGSAGGDSA